MQIRHQIQEVVGPSKYHVHDSSTVLFQLVFYILSHFSEIAFIIISM